MSGIVGQNLGRGSGLIKVSAIDDNAVTLAKMAGLARGKLIYGDTSGDPAALAVGGADEVLTHDGTDFDWAAASGGGKILQVVSGVSSAGATTTSITFTQKSTPTVSITPSSSSNKIYLSGHIYCDPQTAYIMVTFGRVISGGATTTNISGETYGMGMMTVDRESSISFSYLDSPSTTSAVSYYFYFKNHNNSTSVTLGHGTVGASITAMEVQA